jgi:hypothetical protein
MADVFVSYTRTDQELVRPIVALLEAEGWSVWWDTRIVGGERWDEVIESEITAARCAARTEVAPLVRTVFPLR